MIQTRVGEQKYYTLLSMFLEYTNIAPELFYITFGSRLRLQESPTVKCCGKGLLVLMVFVTNAMEINRKQVFSSSPNLLIPNKII